MLISHGLVFDRQLSLAARGTAMSLAERGDAA
jgi:hypothetical protein